MTTNIELYKKLYLIRHSEEMIIKYYAEDDMKTPMHMSLGSEAISVGLCQAMNDQDQVFGTYRSHALYLAKTRDVDDFFAEMYGKDAALLQGKGGSMHLCAPLKGFMGTSAIVAGIIPVAVGAAYANLRNKNNKVVAVFFGDGAIDEGVFWESLNVASLMKLPIIFVCEDNGIAVHTSATARHGYDSISEVVSKFNCKILTSKSTDVEEVYDLAVNAVAAIRRNEGPYFMHLKYYRYLEHVGINYDFNDNYRPKEEFEVWRKQDPVELQRAKLVRLGCNEAQIANIEKEINDCVAQSIVKAKQAGFPSCDVLFKEVI